ncbi:MAG TPA: hypothetical protein VHI52_15045 [Verrucomicrobiae bacterium]|nr:hypothetical protein [Verrucomicrobiae bacterium]
MSEQARVSSLEALESFRSHLIVYASQARPLLEEVSSEVMRTRVWIETDQRTHWEHQFRRRNKELQEAQQALFSARLGILKRESSAEQLLVQRAKRQVEDAETKLRIVKRWARDYEGRVDPLVKQMEKLHTILANDMVKAVAFLTQAIGTLAAYADVKKEPNAGGT